MNIQQYQMQSRQPAYDNGALPDGSRRPPFGQYDPGPMAGPLPGAPPMPAPAGGGGYQFPGSQGTQRPGGMIGGLRMGGGPITGGRMPMPYQFPQQQPSNAYRSVGKRGRGSRAIVRSMGGGIPYGGQYGYQPPQHAPVELYGQQGYSPYGYSLR